MRRLRLALPLLAALLAGIAASSGAAPSGAADAFPPGPAVGERTPGFALADTRGETHTLASLLRPGRRLVVLFFRSADW